MRQYIIRRIAEALVVIFFALTIVFFLVRLSGDPVRLFLPMDTKPKDIEEFRERLGFNDPVIVQYGRFMIGAVQGDFGQSLRYQDPALGLVVARIPTTMQLALVAMVVSLVLSVPVGVMSAANRNSLFDHTGIVGTVLGQSIPGFWLGLMMIFFFSVRLNWLPTGGWGTWQQLIMPTLTLAAYTSARFARLTRSTVLEVLSHDYIRTARAKGLSGLVVLYKHALRNAAIPIVTVVGLQIGQLLGGAVITETIFSLPGLGRFLVTALLNRDFPIVMVGVFLTAVIYTSMNLIVDVVYGLINPRVRFD